MANKKISVLDDAGTLTGAELIPIVQAPDTKKISWTAIKAALKTYFDTLYQSVLGFTPENVVNKDIDGTLAANSDAKYASQKATKTYVDAKAANLQSQINAINTFLNS